MSMLGVRQRLERPVVEHVVLHEHEVPELDEAVAVAVGPAVGPAAAELGPAVVVQLRARAARADRPGLPEVVAAEPHDPLRRHAHLEPELDRLLVGRRPSRRRGRRSPTAGRGRTRSPSGEVTSCQACSTANALEVVADREVAEHLEERQMVRGAPDLVDVDRAEALLHGDEALVRRLLLAEEVALQRLHPGRGDEDALIPCRRHQRPARELHMPGGGEVVDEAASDLVRAHVPRHSTGGYPCAMHGDDTLERFEHARRGGHGGIEPLDHFVLIEPVDDETETTAGLIIPASADVVVPVRRRRRGRRRGARRRAGRQGALPARRRLRARARRRAQAAGRPPRADRPHHRLTCAKRGQTPSGAAVRAGRRWRKSSSTSADLRPGRLAALLGGLAQVVGQRAQVGGDAARQVAQHLAHRPLLRLGQVLRALVERGAAAESATETASPRFTRRPRAGRACS